MSEPLNLPPSAAAGLRRAQTRLRSPEYQVGFARWLAQQRDFVAKWEAEYGEPFPRTPEAAIRMAIRAGMPYSEIMAATLRGVIPVIEGWLQRLRDQRVMASGAEDREPGKADNWEASGFPGWSKWHNWGFGLDERRNWHLFHFRRPTGPRHVARWIHHRRAVVSFAEGLMTELALKLAEEGVIREQDFVRKINPEVSGLRKHLRKIVEAEGHCLKADPLARDNEHRLWRPKARFGRARKRDRAWLFDPTES
ncbi:MAG: hypothetical protein WD069_18615 [Planctomycetales bacterium]